MHYTMYMRVQRVIFMLLLLLLQKKKINNRINCVR